MDLNVHTISATIFEGEVLLKGQQKIKSLWEKFPMGRWGILMD